MNIDKFIKSLNLQKIVGMFIIIYSIHTLFIWTNLIKGNYLFQLEIFSQTMPWSVFIAILIGTWLYNNSQKR